MHTAPSDLHRATRALPSGRALAVVAGACIAALAIGICATFSPPWIAGTGIAISLFFALKLLTLVGECTRAGPRKVLAYLFLWPGMNAATFLAPNSPRPSRPSSAELLFALLKIGLGLTLIGWAARHVLIADPLAVRFVGLVGLILLFHFGVFHVASWAWRRRGVTAPVLMRAPIAARSLAEFWGARWNTAFSELARRFVLRPLARRYGAAWASATVFLVSGLVHEIAISVPVRAGWGRPTLYFLLQALGLAAEKSRTGRRLGLAAGLRGWGWTFLVTALPAPLLFHPPFVDRVVVPLFCFLKEVL